MVDVRTKEGSWYNIGFVNDFNSDSNQQDFSEIISTALYNLEKERQKIAYLEDILQKIKKGEIRTGHITRTISDIEAEKEVIDFIKNKKQYGVKEISIIDIILALNLPMTQINMIMKKLISRGIKEAE